LWLLKPSSGEPLERKGADYKQEGRDYLCSNRDPLPESIITTGG
jgi:hypothetical protein